jgi:hypothetical protein
MMMNLFVLDTFNMILQYQIKFNYNFNECQNITITILNHGPNCIFYFRSPILDLLFRTIEMASLFTLHQIRPC